MRKLIKYIILNIILFVPFMVHASGGLSLSTTYIDVSVGSYGTFNVCLNNAAGRIDMSASGSITLSTTSVFLDNACQTVTVAGNGVGYATVYVYTSDGTTYDDEDITGQSASVGINVYQPATNNNNNNNNYRYVEPTPEVKSNDTTLSSVNVGNYEVTKDGNNYYVTVPSDVDKVNITANTTQLRASLTGSGEKTLAPGENTFTIKVVAPDGTTAEYNVIITRKTDYFKLTNLDEALALDTTNVNFKLQDGDLLSVEILEKMRASGKNINLYYYDGNNVLLYVWIIDPENFDFESEFNPILTLTIEDKETILKKINYVDSIIFMCNTIVPNGVKLRFSVDSKYTKDDVLAAYKYDNGTITLNRTNDESSTEFAKINTNFFELVPDSNSTIIITKGNLLLNNNNGTVLSKIKTVTSKKYFWISVAELAVICALGFYLVIREVNRKKPKTAVVTGDNNLFEKLFDKPKKEKVEFMVPGVVPPQKVIEEDKPIFTAEVPVNIVPPVVNNYTSDTKKEEVTNEESKKEIKEEVVSAPVVEAPVVEAPVVEAPVVEAPVVETPVVEQTVETEVTSPKNEEVIEPTISDVPPVITPPVVDTVQIEARVTSEDIPEEKEPDGSINTVTLDKLDIK